MIHFFLFFIKISIKSNLSLTLGSTSLIAPTSASSSDPTQSVSE